MNRVFFIQTQLSILASLFVEWSDSSVDDDLRLGVALSIAEIPVKCFSQHSGK
jgi:hypothetical protein